MSWTFTYRSTAEYRSRVRIRILMIFVNTAEGISSVTGLTATMPVPSSTNNRAKICKRLNKWKLNIVLTVRQLQLHLLRLPISTMSHCAPEATIRLKFTTETVVSNVLVAQVCWEAVPNTWPDSSKSSCRQMCCVCVELRTICRSTSGAGV